MSKPTVTTICFQVPRSLPHVGTVQGGIVSYHPSLSLSEYAQAYYLGNVSTFTLRERSLVLLFSTDKCLSLDFGQYFLQFNLPRYYVLFCITTFSVKLQGSTSIVV